MLKLLLLIFGHIYSCLCDVNEDNSHIDILTLLERHRLYDDLYKAAAYTFFKLNIARKRWMNWKLCQRRHIISEM